MGSIKAADCTVGTKRTIWGKYRGVIVGPDGAMRTLRERHRKREDALAHARRVLDFAGLIAVQKMEHDTKDN